MKHFANLICASNIARDIKAVNIDMLKWTRFAFNTAQRMPILKVFKERIHSDVFCNNKQYSRCDSTAVKRAQWILRFSCGIFFLVIATFLKWILRERNWVQMKFIYFHEIQMILEPTWNKSFNFKWPWNYSKRAFISSIVRRISTLSFSCPQICSSKEKPLWTCLHLKFILQFLEIRKKNLNNNTAFKTWTKYKPCRCENHNILTLTSWAS